MKSLAHTFQAEVWLWPGDKAAWHFISLPKNLSQKIHAAHKSTRGFGSLRVVATIGKTSWTTSIFPDKKSETFLLPLKSEVRRKEGVQRGDHVKVSITIEKHG